MKVPKIAAILLLVAVLASGCACGDGTGSKPTPKPTTPTEPTATATATLAVTPTATPLPPVRIYFIDWEGKVPFTESDEYVAIKNYGDEPLNLERWELIDLTDGEPSYTFSFCVLEPARTVRVYTNQYHQEWGGHSFFWPEPVWNNTHPDTAALYNAQGELVSTKSYVID
jgi:hypothetical protein